MMTLTSRRLSALTLLAALSAGGFVAARSQAPQAPPIFRAEANLVEVIVRVTDRDGRFIPDLAQADFALEEEGHAQTVVAFNRVDLPRTPVTVEGTSRPVLGRPVMSSVATNAAVDEARLFVVLMDDMMTAPQFSIPARRAARAFVEQHVGPNDLVAVFSTGGFSARTQEFTADKARVIQTIDRFMGQRCRFEAGRLMLPPVSDAERVYGIRVATDVIRAVADHLSGVRGRRVSLLWVGEGVDYNLIPPISGTVGPGSGGGDSGTVIWAMNEAVHTLRKANVTLYAVDPRHLYAEDRGKNNPLCRDPSRAEFQRSVDVLERFSNDTGGFAAVQSNDYTPQFERILDENSQYYVLGYQPNRPGRDGEIRRIRVLVIRPGLERAVVSSRASYTVSSPEPPPPSPPGTGPALAAALTSSLPTAGLPLRVQAVPRRSTTGRGLVYVIAEASGAHLQFAEKNGRFTERLEFGLLTADRLARQGNVQPVAMDLSLTAAQLAQIRHAGVRWLTTIDLDPGHYSLRVAVHALHTNRTGAIFLDVDVPQYDDNRMWIDGVALTSRVAPLTATSGTSPMSLGLPGPPTTARTFVKGDVITVGAEIGLRRDFTNGAVELTVHEQSAEREAPPALTRTVPLADRATAEQPRAFAIDTAALGPGQFVLRLAVRDQENRRAETAVLFEVIEQQVQSSATH
jgi:VWFA-related protein